MTSIFNYIWLQKNVENSDTITCLKRITDLYMVKISITIILIYPKIPTRTVCRWRQASGSIPRILSIISTTTDVTIIMIYHDCHPGCYEAPARRRYNAGPASLTLGRRGNNAEPASCQGRQTCLKFPLLLCKYACSISKSRPKPYPSRAAAQRWANVCDAGPTLSRRPAGVLCSGSSDIAESVSRVLWNTSVLFEWSGWIEWTVPLARDLCLETSLADQSRSWANA